MGGGRGETATPLLFVSTLAALPHTAHPTHHAHPMCPFRPMRWLVVVASRRRTRSWRNVKGAGGELWLGLVIGLAAAALPAAKSGRRPSRPRRKRLRSSDAGGSDVLRRGGDRDVTAAGCSHPPGGRIHIFHILGYLNMKNIKHIKKIPIGDRGGCDGDTKIASDERRRQSGDAQTRALTGPRAANRQQPHLRPRTRTPHNHLRARGRASACAARRGSTQL